MHSIPHSLVTLFLILSLLLSLWAGSRLGTSARHRGNHDKDQLGTIQGAILGLLGLILGFSLSGAMGRFVDRQDALAKEAAAIETAYERAELLPSVDVIRASLHEYAVLRLELFGQDSTNKSMEIEARMRDCYIAARTAVYENARAMPQLASFAVTGMESVQDEFARRSALERRALPLEMVLALVVASCLSIGIIGYGIGLAERRSFGPAMTLAGLVALTLFMTIDFDRPRSGFVMLDPAPLHDAVSNTTAIGAR